MRPASPPRILSVRLFLDPCPSTPRGGVVLTEARRASVRPVIGVAVLAMAAMCLVATPAFALSVPATLVLGSRHQGTR